MTPDDAKNGVLLPPTIAMTPKNKQGTARREFS